jgi:hypothetical protein
MEIKVIGLIAAMPEEIKPLLNRAGAYSREKLDGFDSYKALESAPCHRKKTMDNAAIAPAGEEFAVGGR